MNRHMAIPKRTINESASSQFKFKPANLPDLDPSVDLKDYDMDTLQSILCALSYLESEDINLCPSVMRYEHPEISYERDDDGDIETIYGVKFPKYGNITETVSILSANQINRGQCSYDMDIYLWSLDTIMHLSVTTCTYLTSDEGEFASAFELYMSADPQKSSTRFTPIQFSAKLFVSQPIGEMFEFRYIGYESTDKGSNYIADDTPGKMTVYPIKDNGEETVEIVKEFYTKMFKELEPKVTSIIQ